MKRTEVTPEGYLSSRIRNSVVPLWSDQNCCPSIHLFNFLQTIRMRVRLSEKLTI